MTREQLASALDEIGLLLELQGANPFKTRAYLSAARTVRALEMEPAAWIAGGEMRATRGIGKALSDKITTFVETGSLPYLDDLREAVPKGLLDWLKVPGLGPRKALRIHQALEISTLGELEYACKENRLRDLEGFGEASQKKILHGIGRLHAHQGRHLQSVMLDEAEALRQRLERLPSVRRLAIAGSVRRRLETSKDIDIVVVADDPVAVMDAFVDHSTVAEVSVRGDTKCSIELHSGAGVDLRVVSDQAFPYTLLYFTGNREHNVELRKRAQRAGYKLNEYALEPTATGQAPICREEADIYNALGLCWIPPELREDRGEFEAAESGALPELICHDSLVGVLHCHSSWSDGSATIREMAEAARERGLAYLGLCDHSQSATYAGGLSPTRVLEQHQEIDAINAEYAGEFVVLKGIEVDILAEGELDYDDETLARFELIVASVHSRFNLSLDAQTARIQRAVKNPWVDILGHPTGRLLLARDGYPLDLRMVMESAITHDVAIEVNAHPRRLDLDWRELQWGIARGLVTSINPDAHAPAGLDDMHYGVGIARKGWATREHVLNALSLDALRERLRERKVRAAARSGR